MYGSVGEIVAGPDTQDVSPTNVRTFSVIGRHRLSRQEVGDIVGKHPSFIGSFTGLFAPRSSKLPIE